MNENIETDKSIERVKTLLTCFRYYHGEYFNSYKRRMDFVEELQRELDDAVDLWLEDVAMKWRKRDEPTDN